MPASTARPAPARIAARAASTVLALAVTTAMLTACAPDANAPLPTPSASSSPTTGGADPSATPSPDATGGSSGAIDDERADNLAAAVSSGNTAAIEGYLTTPTRVVIAASEADLQYDPIDAVLAIDYVQPGVGVWTFEVDAATLASYAASPDYGAFFPSDAIVGVSDAGAVISFVPTGTQIGTVFMAIDESLITG